MFRLIWIASVNIHFYLRRYMPSNRLLDLIRTRRGLKWGVPAMLVSAPYFAIAYWCTVLIGNGAPGWLNLVVLVCIWSAFKFIIMGPVSLILLGKVRLAEHRRARAEARALAAQQGPSAPAGYEALPGDDHGPTHRGRVSGALHT